MRGQTLAIGVVTDTYMRAQRVYKYKYEVLSQDSAYFGKVDWIYYEDVLRAGHHYEVRVNDNTSNPRILEVLRELERPAATDSTRPDGV